MARANIGALETLYRLCEVAWKTSLDFQSKRVLVLDATTTSESCAAINSLTCPVRSHAGAPSGLTIPIASDSQPRQWHYGLGEML